MVRQLNRRYRVWEIRSKCNLLISQFPRRLNLFTRSPAEPGNAYPEALPPFWEVFCRVRRCQNFALSLEILDGDAPDYCVMRICEIFAFLCKFAIATHPTAN